MNSISVQEIQCRGISAVDELLQEGPVQVVENDRTRYIVLRAEDYERLIAGPSAWDWLERPSRATPGGDRCRPGGRARCLGRFTVILFLGR